jgi:hypothetical protein
VCSSEGTARASTAHNHIPRTSYFKTLSSKSPIPQVQAYLKWPRCRCVNVLERNGNPPLKISLLEVCLPRGVQGLWLATFLRAARGVDLARLSPRAKRAHSDWQATVNLGCPRWKFQKSTYIFQELECKNIANWISMNYKMGSFMSKIAIIWPVLVSENWGKDHFMDDIDFKARILSEIFQFDSCLKFMVTGTHFLYRLGWWLVDRSSSPTSVWDVQLEFLIVIRQVSS